MRIYNYPSKTAEKQVGAIVNRELSFRKKDYQSVNRILDDVRRHGDEAVIKYARRFDAPQIGLESLKVSAEELKAAQEGLTKREIRKEIGGRKDSPPKLVACPECGHEFDPKEK